MKERVCIFVDAGNFHHLTLKKLGVRDLDFNFDDFVKFLARDRLVIEMGKRYYVGTVRERLDDPKSKESMSEQTKLFSILKKEHWEIKTSKLRRRVEEVAIDQRTVDYSKLHRAGFYKIQYERWREKGIDVKLATDLIVGAFDNKYDTAIIISSDGDLIPAIDLVRNRLRKKVEYIGFSIIDRKDDRKSTKPLLSMITKTDIQRTIVEEDLRPFIKTESSLFNI